MASLIDLPLVLVEWLDANTGNEELDTDNVDIHHKPWVIHTLGWVLKYDDVGITVVTEFYDNTYRGRTFIPAQMIVSITPYTLARARKPRNATSPAPAN